jgi:hypothetical protein
MDSMLEATPRATGHDLPGPCRPLWYAMDTRRPDVEHAKQRGPGRDSGISANSIRNSALLPVKKATQEHLLTTVSSLSSPLEVHLAPHE